MLHFIDEETEHVASPRHERRLEKYILYPVWPCAQLKISIEDGEEY